MCSYYHAEKLLSRGFAKISVHFSKKLKQTAKRKKFAVSICKQQAFWGKQKAALPGGAEQLCFQNILSVGKMSSSLFIQIDPIDRIFIRIYSGSRHNILDIVLHQFLRMLLCFRKKLFIIGSFFI